MRRALCFVLFCSFMVCVQAQKHSWDGNGISSDAHFRVLNIYVNIIYDTHPDTNNMFTDTIFWRPLPDTTQEGVNAPGTIPTYLLSLFDTSYVVGNTHGCITRIFGESSFDALQISGDNVVVNVRESSVIADPTPPNHTYCQTSPFCYNKITKVAIDIINDSGGLKTVFGHDSLSDYSLQGASPTLYYTNVLIRNITKDYGGINPGSGFGFSPINGLKIGNRCYSSQKGTLQCIGDGDFSSNPTGVLTHELGHSLFGGNNFHTSGGNHRGSTGTMPWMNIQGGYGLMGGGNSGLVSCNGYERWRMHWKHASSPYYISAHNISNNMYVNSDIKKEDGTKWFVLRDFVTYGDAVRIKLPYKDSIHTPNQYIWLEFHNVGHNNKLDFLQFSNSSCLDSGRAGIYAYYQIGRDILESTDIDDVWDNINRDNLRIISNEGYWDYEQHRFPSDTDMICVGWNWVPYYYEPKYSNAFCGYQDQEKFIIPSDYDTDLANMYDSASSVNAIKEYSMYNKCVNGEFVTHSIPTNGDPNDAFVCRKINMGTNPSTCNAKTYYSSSYGTRKFIFYPNQGYNQSTTYLTGLSIEMIPRPDSVSYLVKIRWDDYDIVDDARWTGKIALKGAERVNLTRGHDITLAQNRTPAQRLRDSESGYFAAPTKLTCEAGSVFAQEPQSTLTLTEKSRFVLDSGAVYQLGDSAQILVQGASTFTISKGADFTGGIASEIVVDSLSTLYVYDTAKLRREARLIIRPGGKLIVDGGTQTNACTGEMWEGFFSRQYATYQHFHYLCTRE